ncbi:MAG: hypothetical protein IKZ38_01420 [Clostridia bacterium]|nr:hypothetical protein [Clostridia bacterium]
MSRKKLTSDKNVGQKQTFLLFIYRNLIFIILAVVLSALCGFGYGILTVDPVYTKTSTVMLVTGIDTASGQASGSNNVTLSQIHLPNVVKMLSSNEFITGANNIYTKENTGEVTKKGISVRFNDNDSLIFSISYSDSSYEIAEAKLDAVIQNAQLRLKDYLKADDIQLKETCNVRLQQETYSYFKYIVLGVGIGLVLAVGALTLVYFLDNTAKDREEIEMLTGVNVLAYIDRADEPKFTDQIIKK